MWRRTVLAVVLCMIVATGRASDAPTITKAAPSAEGLFAATPMAKITGPQQGVAGEMAIFEAEGSKGKSFDWLVLPEVTFHRGENGQSISLGTRKTGTYYVVLIVTAGDKSAKAVSKFFNGTEPDGPPQPGPKPGPKPNPNPNPNPAPADWLQALQQAAATSKDKIPADLDRDYVAKHVAAALQAVVADIKGGKYTKNAEIASAVQRGIRQEIGDDSADKLTDWGKWLGGQIEQNVAHGNLSTPASFADAYTAIARGLTGG